MSEEEKVVFRKRKAPRATRARQSDESGEEVDSALLEAIIELRKERKRPKVFELNSIKDEPDKEKTKEKVGGCIDAKTLKKAIKDEDIHQITSFAVETNKRDEDDHLKKYIEERLAQIKGADKVDEIEKMRSKSAEDVLFELPENIKQVTQKKKTEETLSEQMLSGIPEVDLGIGAKIKNIEATEEAKMKLLRERLNRRENGTLEFVPSNVAVNYVQHNRFNIEDSNLQMGRIRREAAKPTSTPDDRCGTATSRVNPHQEKATDDFHYEKFKRRTRKF